MLLCTIRTS